MTIYLDYAATTPLKDEVFREMLPYLTDCYENPSSLYENAIRNKKAINEARQQIAELIHAKPKEVYFTSGGSEANNWALKGLAYRSRFKREIITTSVEHHSISQTAEFLKSQGFIVHYLEVDEEGFVNLQQLESIISQKTLVVSIIFANNEIGTIQDLHAIGSICSQYDVLLHVDAVAATGHIELDLNKLSVDLLSMSAHKFYGPKGIGALYIKEGVELENLIHGGMQERGRRAGTEQVANIIGMAKALKTACINRNSEEKRQKKLLVYLYERLMRKVKGVRLNGPSLDHKSRLSGTINLGFKNVDASLLCFQLNKKGIYVSTGSACNSSSIEPSHVLQAINVPDDYIEGSIRISVGEMTSLEHIEYVCDEIINLVTNE